jgi:hypothetical protein
MSLKSLIDIADSRNFVTMYNIDGQPGNWNVFLKDSCNQLLDHPEFANKLISIKFLTVAGLIHTVGLLERSKIDELSFKLIFFPCPGVNISVHFQ